MQIELQVKDVNLNKVINQPMLQTRYEELRSQVKEYVEAKMDDVEWMAEFESSKRTELRMGAIVFVRDRLEREVIDKIILDKGRKRNANID